MEKTDLVKTCRPYYSAKMKPEYRLTEPGAFLSITGEGDPSRADYAERIHALYATAFEIRKLCRAEGVDFVVPKLEVLWDFSTTGFTAASLAEMPRRDCGYCLMLRMPGFVTRARVALASAQVSDTDGLAVAEEIELHARLEERVVQLLHKGTFEKESLSVARIEAFMREQGLLQDGLYHEIYLRDIPDVEPALRRIIIRIPVKMQGAGRTRLRRK